MQISCAFPTTLGSAEHIRIAEELGYDRAWLYDTPQQSPTSGWSSPSRRPTERIGLGPACSSRPCATRRSTPPPRARWKPSHPDASRRLRHRLHRPAGHGLRRHHLGLHGGYIDAYTGLLRGETIEWEGARMRMMHPDETPAPARRHPHPHRRHRPQRSRPGPPTRPRRARRHPARPALAGFPGGLLPLTARSETTTRPRPTNTSEQRLAPDSPLVYHSAYEFAGSAVMETLPGGREWLAVINRSPTTNATSASTTAT